MKLKRFVAKDMREALTMVKDELGADAIIMSNKRVATGVEIVAGVESLPAPMAVPNGMAGLPNGMPTPNGMAGLPNGMAMPQGQVALGYAQEQYPAQGYAPAQGMSPAQGMGQGMGPSQGMGPAQGMGMGAPGANTLNGGGNGHQIGSALANLANAIAMSGQQRVLSNEGITLNSPELAASLESNPDFRQAQTQNSAMGSMPMVPMPSGPVVPNVPAVPSTAAPLSAQDPAEEARKAASNKHQAYAKSLIEILERQNTMSKEQGAQLMEDIAAQQNAKSNRMAPPAGFADAASGLNGPAAPRALGNQAAVGTFSANNPNIPSSSATPRFVENQQGMGFAPMPAATAMSGSPASAASANTAVPLRSAVPAAAPDSIKAQTMGAQGLQAPLPVSQNQQGRPQVSPVSPLPAGASNAGNVASESPAYGGMRSVDEDSLKGTGVSRIINPIEGEDDDMANDPMKKAGPSRIDPSLDEDADLFKTPPLPLSQQREFKNFFGKSKARQEKEDYESRAGIETYRQGGADATVVRQDLEKMRAEVENIRKLLQFELAGLLQDNRSRNEPVKAMIYKLLHSVGFSDTVSDLLVNRLPAEISFNSAWREIVKLLERSIVVGDDEIISQGGIVTLIGPAGVGKTTTLAKLAARFVMRYGPQRVAIITADHYRIGAVEQIKTYGRIMGCATFAVKNLSELPQLLYTLSDKSLILVDTAGVGFKDERFNTQLSQLKLQASLKLKHYLVLPCTTQRKVLQHAYEHFSVVGLTGLILTKIDECQNLGDALSLCIEMKLPISYITDGQRVPEDLDIPNPHSLAHRALSAIEDDAAQRSLAASKQQ